MKMFRNCFPYSSIEAKGLITIKELELGHITITIIGLDSSNFISISTGQVEEEVLKTIEKEIHIREKGIKEDIINIKIVALHHHLIRIPHHEHNERHLMLKEAATVLDRLKKIGIDIVLMGHKHIAYYQEDINKYHVKNMQLYVASSLCRKRLKENGYYVFEFNRDTLAVYDRRYDNNNNEFIENKRQLFNISSEGIREIIP